jgi:hypothetical protein
MQRDLIATLAIAAAVGAAVVTGLVYTGGPGAGRAERRDEVRLRDLGALADLTRCLADLDDHRLPDRLGPEPRCGTKIALADPFTGTPYRYDRLSDWSFRLCAVLERPEAAGPVFPEDGTFDETTGCLTVSYNP